MRSRMPSRTRSCGKRRGIYAPGQRARAISGPKTDATHCRSSITSVAIDRNNGNKSASTALTKIPVASNIIYRRACTGRDSQKNSWKTFTDTENARTTMSRTMMRAVNHERFDVNVGPKDTLLVAAQTREIEDIP